MVFCFLFKVFLLILRERACAQAEEGQRERERDRIPTRLLIVSTEPDAGLDLRNREIITLAEFKSHRLNQLSQPGAPEGFFHLVIHSINISMHYNRQHSHKVELSTTSISRSS